jgi:hypothetical protein
MSEFRCVRRGHGGGWEDACRRGNHGSLALAIACTDRCGAQAITNASGRLFTLAGGPLSASQQRARDGSSAR